MFGLQSSDLVATEQFQYCYIKVQTLHVFLGKVPPIGVPGTTPTAEVTFLLLLSIVWLFSIAAGSHFLHKTVHVTFPPVPTTAIVQV